MNKSIKFQVLSIKKMFFGKWKFKINNRFHSGNTLLTRAGFTLMELLLVMGIMGILATVVVAAVNPNRQFAKARDTQREADLVSILSAIFQYASEHSGELPDTDGNSATSNFPTSLTCIGTGSGCFNLGGAGAAGDTIVPVYMVELRKDPKTGTDANTGYRIMVDANGHLTASASGETKTITAKR